MKYANLRNLSRNTTSEIEQLVNIGDYIQLIALDMLYKTLGFDKDGVVYLSARELESYDGEEVILPINFIFQDDGFNPFASENVKCFSEKIKPLFLGMSFSRGKWALNEDRINYLKKNGPIGCRDQYAYEELKKNGVDSYLAGCITLLFPERSVGVYNKYYFVDVPSSLVAKIPSDLRKKAVFRNHMMTVKSDIYNDFNYMYNFAKQRLCEYRDNAEVVVTSRLHCAMPCLAMGIPVILVKDYYGHPFSLLKKFVRQYAPSEFDYIDWHPTKVDMTDYKKVAMACAKKRLLGESSLENILALHNQYADLYKDGYVEPRMQLDKLVNELSDRFSKNSYFEYSLWGLNDDAERIFQYISNAYPNAKFVNAYDTFKKVTFHGVESLLPNAILPDCCELIIVTSINCAAAAVPFLDALGGSVDYICCADPMYYA